LKEIHVAGKRLPLNPSVFDGKHGTVLDSGTTYAYLPEEAFLAFKEAVSSLINIFVEAFGFAFFNFTSHFVNTFELFSNLSLMHGVRIN
jgi:hypothetical protein